MGGNLDEPLNCGLEVSFSFQEKSLTTGKIKDSLYKVEYLGEQTPTS